MDPTIRSFFLGFIKIHILYHAAKEPVYGLWLIDELRQHGYDISPGTLYPIFHSLEESEMLRSDEKVVNGKVRKYYRATLKGKNTLKEAKIKVHELLQELIEERRTP
jgi:PadR family transcriptional regulator PadR